MDELMKALREAETNAKALEKSISETKYSLNTTASSINSRTQGSKQLNDLNEAKKKTQKVAPVISFPKSTRFAGGSSSSDTVNSSLDNSQMSQSTEADGLSSASTISMNAYKTRPPQVVFPKSHRWNAKQQEDTRPAYDANYDTVKRKAQRTVIPSPNPTKTKKQILKEQAKQAQLGGGAEGMRESIETVRVDLQQEQDLLSDILSDTTEIVGPGRYQVNFEAVETRTSVAFPKTERFKDPKDPGPADILYPSLDAVKKRLPTARIVASSSTNDKLKTKKRNEEIQEEIRAAAELTRPLDRDRALQPNIPGVTMRERLACLSHDEKLAYFLFMLRNRRNDTKRGPGEYAPRVARDTRSRVVYRKSHSMKVPPRRIKMPAPNSYYAKDDLIRVHQPKYTIPNAGKNRKPKLEDLDRRPALNPDLNAVRPRPQAAIIFPEPTVEHYLELHEVKLGPGYYTAQHKLVEARTDKGNVKYQDVTEGKDREAEMDMANKEVFQGDLKPNYDYDKPNKGTFKYYEPTVVQPPNIPESKLHPENWKFYDPNLDAVREEAIAQDFARNMTKDEFKTREEEFDAFMRYRNRKNRQPEVGQYDVRYDAIDPSENAVDFGRYPERGLDPLDRDALADRSLEGDNLILSPMKPGKRLADIKFDRMIGRPEDDGREETKEELILEPNDALTKKRQPMLVNMKKDSERPAMFDRKVDENAEELVLDLNRGAVEPRIKGVLDLKKMTTREDTIDKKPTGDEEVEINPNYDVVRKRIGNAVNMEREAKRFADKPDENIRDGVFNTELRIDAMKALEATKPEKNTTDFRRFAPRENPELTKQIEQRVEEARKKSPKGPREITKELETDPNKNKRIYLQKPKKKPEPEDPNKQIQKSPEALGPWDES